MPLMRLVTLTILVSILLGMVVSPAQADLLAQLKATGLLHICADPDNPPFSSRDPREPGYDVELSGEIAAQLGARAEITWVSTFLGRSAIRQVLEGKCDLFMGLPQDERFLNDYPRLVLSRSYYTLGHVLVSPQARAVKELRGLPDLRVAVEGMSMGDIFLFQNHQPRAPYRTQPEAFQAVVHGEAPVALLWAPVGWWLARKHPEAQLQVTELSLPNLEFQVAAGMRKGDAAFQSAVNTAIAQMVTQGKVADVLSRYGQPPTVVAQAAPDVSQGRSLYYQVCALCHGQSAEGGGPVPNLKEFQGSEERFIKISLNGRPDKGMPPWQGKLSEDEIRLIFAFIQSLPK